jgi:hypothetical protein
MRTITGARTGILMKRLATLLLLPAAVAIVSMLQLCFATAAGAVPEMMASAAVIDRTCELDPAITATFFDQPSSIQMIDSVQLSLRNGKFSACAPQAVGAVSFADETLLEQAVSSGTLPEGTDAVIYDAEGWTRTPDVQKQSVTNLAFYYHRAANAAHKAGLLLIGRRR